MAANWRGPLTPDVRDAALPVRATPPRGGALIDASKHSASELHPACSCSTDHCCHATPHTASLLPSTPVKKANGRPHPPCNTRHTPHAHTGKASPYGQLARTSRALQLWAAPSLLGVQSTPYPPWCCRAQHRPPHPAHRLRTPSSRLPISILHPRQLPHHSSLQQCSFRTVRTALLCSLHLPAAPCWPTRPLRA
jgi:hypothetical protein